MELMVVPKPQSVKCNETAKNFEWKECITITLPENRAEFLFCAQLLAESLQEKLCREIRIAKEGQDADVQQSVIRLCVSRGYREEEYEVSVSQERIAICGSTRKGILYGVQTLRQIVAQFGASVPAMEIHDYPRYAIRGFYHDITRGRVPTLDFLKSLADKLSFYKMNHLELYVEHTYLFSFFPQLCEQEDYLTAEEIRAFDSYCREREIELVPSLASFGHLYHLLRTKEYAHLCELADTENVPFSFWGRMSHHTIDVSNEESLALVLRMTDEYMSLFTSRYYNLCGDETFDLGKGRSKALADEIGTQRMYLDFVKKICEHLTQNGRIPMFWGDVIGNFPESIRELPPETICLNWGYDPNVSEESTKKLAAAGATQVLCPGAQGWNHLVNDYRGAYANITRMCGYADRYDAQGVLTTDWGDYGHINSPYYSIPCMIYGAAHSWNRDAIPEEALNDRISFHEYGDDTGARMRAIREINDCVKLSWFHAVLLVQGHIDGIDVSADISRIDSDEVAAANRRLHELSQALSGTTNEILESYRNAIDGIILLNEAGAMMAAGSAVAERLMLVARLHDWFREYSRYWLKISKRSELYRIGEIIDGICKRLTDKVEK